MFAVARSEHGGHEIQSPLSRVLACGHGLGSGFLLHQSFALLPSETTSAALGLGAATQTLLHTPAGILFSLTQRRPIAFLDYCEILVLDLRDDSLAAACAEFRCGPGDNAFGGEVVPRRFKSPLHQADHVIQTTRANDRNNLNAETLRDIVNVVSL